MNYEKKYNEVLEKAKQVYNTPYTAHWDIMKDLIEHLFSELKESEDERIRKALLRCCDDWEKGQFGCMKAEDVPAIRAYLEKQKEQQPLSTEETELNSIAFLEQLGYTCVPPRVKQKPAENHDLVAELKHHLATTPKEQLQKEWDDLKEWGDIGHTVQEFLYGKPAEWSEEDEAALGDLMWCIEQARKSAKDENDMGNIWFAENWLKKRIKSIHPQPKQEWSEEDITNGWRGVDSERYLSCLQRLGTGNPQQPETINSKWFKEHCRPQPHWKPSEEQMEALKRVVCNRPIGSAELNSFESLYNDLKKL